MQEIILDTLLDAFKMLPFLFGAYLLMEFLEHRASAKLTNMLSHSGKFGAIGGAIAGCVPQCGFSVAAANLYAGGVITMGTLVAVFISTSDEAIPLLLANPEYMPVIGKLILWKLCIAIVAGLLLDFVIYRPTLQTRNKAEIHRDCVPQDTPTHEVNILSSAAKHTAGTFAFLLIIMLLLNFVIAAIGEARLASILMTGSWLQPFIAALIGFIPNCAASVLLTQLFISGSITFGSIIAGLTTSAGIGMIVLLKNNASVRDNLRIICYLYITAVIVGSLLQISGI